MSRPMYQMPSMAKNTPNKSIPNRHISVGVNSDDEEFEVISNYSAIGDEIKSNTNYYASTNEAFDPEAPLYVDLTRQWKLGKMPVNPTGSKTLLLKVSDVMTSALIDQYKAAGCTTMKFSQINTSIVPTYFLQTCFGTARFRVTVGEFFDTQIGAIYNDFQSEINQDILGYEIEVDFTMSTQEILDVVIVTYLYNWYNVSFAMAPLEGTFLTLLAQNTITAYPYLPVSVSSAKSVKSKIGSKGGVRDLLPPQWH